MAWKMTSTSPKKTGGGKMVTRLVFGSIMGDMAGLWFAPASEDETIRKIKCEVKDIQNKAKIAVGNLEELTREPAGYGSRDRNEVIENE